MNNNVFGQRNAQSLEDLLSVAYYDFKAWCKARKISCSQRPFTKRMVIKKAHGYYMSAKAYNGRIILSWLSERSCEVVAAGSCSDPMVITQAAALRLGLNYFLFHRLRIRIIRTLYNK